MQELCGAENLKRLHFLMDYRANTKRYEEQLAELEKQAATEAPLDAARD
jgi:hypothetical protein